VAAFVEEELVDAGFAESDLDELPDDELPDDELPDDEDSLEDEEGDDAGVAGLDAAEPSFWAGAIVLVLSERESVR
jgi:hypothetical protein